MQKVNRPQGKWRNVVFVCVGLFVILADYLSKAWIRSNLEVGQSLLDVGFFRVVRVQNTGAAFGLFKDHSLVFIIAAIIGITVILLLVFVWHSRWSFLDSILVRVAIGLIVGGTVGNLIDRLLHQGRVTDFVDFKVWPAFNVADSAAVIGGIIIVYSIIFLKQPATHRNDSGI